MLDTSKLSDDHIEMIYLDEQQREIHEKYHTIGTFEEWCKACELIQEYPIPWALLYAACAAYFLTPLKRGNIIIDVAGLTSRGKTISLQFAASSSGDPRKGAGLVNNWGVTAYALEKLAEYSNDHPVFLDDSKNMRGDVKNVSTFIYMIYDGKGRARGSKEGLRESSHFSNIFLSTGEVPLSSLTEDQGARARVLSLRGLPFGDRDQGELVQTLEYLCETNYGHLRERVVAYLSGRYAEWSDMREELDGYIMRWKEIITSPFGKRAADWIGLMEYVAHILHEELGVPRPTTDVFGYIEAQTRITTQQADRCLSALDGLQSWIVSNQSNFCSHTMVAINHSPPGGWWGSIDDGKYCVLTDQVKNYLIRNGYDYQSIIEEWGRRGFFKKSKFKIGQSRVRGYIFGVYDIERALSST